MRKIALLLVATLAFAGGLFAQTGDFTATMNAQTAANLGVSETGSQSFTITVPLEMVISQDQTLLAPAYNPTLGQIGFLDAGAVPVVNQNQAVHLATLDYLIVDLNGSWQEFYYNPQRQLMTKTFSGFNESQFQSQSTLGGGLVQLAQYNQLQINASNVAWGQISGGLNTAAGIATKGANWAQAQGNWYLVSSTSGVGVRFQPEAQWAFEDQAISWWNNANPGSPVTLAQMRVTLLSENLKDVPTSPTQAPVNFPVASYSAALSDFRADVYAQLLAFDTATTLGQSTFLTVCHNYLPMALGTSVSNPNAGWGFLDSSIYIAPTNGVGYDQLYHQFMNAQHYTQNIETLKYDIDPSTSSKIAQTALHYLVGLEAALRTGSVSTSGLTSQESSLWSAFQTAITNLPNTDESQDSLSATTLNSSVLPGAGVSTGSKTQLTFVQSPDPALVSADLLWIPVGSNLLTSATVTNFGTLTGLENIFNPQPTASLPNIQFTSPQVVGSIVVWCNSGVALTTLSYVDAQGQTQTINLAPLGSQMTTATNPDGSEHLIVATATTGSAYSLMVYNLATPVTVASMSVGLTGGNLNALRVYSSAQTSFPYSWIISGFNVAVSSPSAVDFSGLECFSTQQLALAPYFVQDGFGWSPALHQQVDGFADFSSPVRYAAGGIETPLSYNLKIWNNRQWKGPSTSPFAYSELDLASNALNGQFQYASVVTPTAPSTEPTPYYPFTFGTTVPNVASEVLVANSPYFVDKIAGLDSVGLLESLLASIQDGSSSIANQSEGFLTGSVFQNRWHFRLSLPEFTSSSAPIAWPQTDYSKTPLEIDNLWFLQNSRAVLTPSEVRIGDLLVGYEGNEISVAIVESVPTAPTIATSSDLWAWMKGIQVVSINHVLQHAVETSWANLSLHPFEYHVRRLVLSAPVSMTLSSSLTKIPMLEPIIVNNTAGLSVLAKPLITLSTIDLMEFRYTADKATVVAGPITYTFERHDGWQNWIPNTGELHWLGSITLTSGTYFDGESWSLDQVLDFGYNSSLPYGGPNGNIYDNTPNTNSSAPPPSTTGIPYPPSGFPSTTFFLVALPAPMTENGISVLDSTPNITTTDSRYVPLWEITYLNSPTITQQYLVTPIQPVGGSFAFVVDKNQLEARFIPSASPLAPITYSRFALIAANPHPGDDIQLVFGLGDSSINASYLNDTVNNPRLAVYDKKMLWRANLYIQEQANDWNDEHPWIGELNADGTINSSGANFNDWNRYYDGTQVFTTIDDLPLVTSAYASAHGLVAGGQGVRIQPVTSPIVGVAPVKAVTYDYPENATPTLESANSLRSFDTPFSYESKIPPLVSALQPLFDASGNAAGGTGNWTLSTAPKKLWINYWSVLTPLNSNLPLPGVGLLWAEVKDGVLFTPQTGLDPQSVYLLQETGYDPPGAGVDCVGFAKNAVAYGTNYIWSQNPGRNYPDKVNGVMELAELADVDLNTGKSNKIKYVIPGDVMYYYSASVEAHIAIVLSSDGSGSTSGIQLIESTHWAALSISNVSIKRTLNDLIAGATWVIARLK